MSEILGIRDSQELRSCLITIAKWSAPVVVAICAFKGYRTYARNQRQKAYPKDTVILHQFPRWFRAPSASPYALKLETWLRMSGIQYQNELSYEFGPKGKMPWITLNGEDVSDSQFCIEFLSQKFGVDLSVHLNTVDKAVAWAFLKLTEESLDRIMLLNRFVLEPDSKNSGLPWIMLVLFKRPMLKKAKVHGYGLHTKEQIHSIGRSDLKSINDFIGNKKFLFGEKACDVDATVFAAVCQIYYHERGQLFRYISTDCGNIVRYIDNMKDAFWPDWEQNTTEKLD